MRKNKMLMFIIVTIIVILIAVLGYMVCKNIENAEENVQEYTPEEEISDSQLRMTNIELYFINKESHEIEKEIKNIDAKYLIDKPIEFVINELIKGPENESFEGVIPENSILISSEFLDGILYLNFNENLINDEANIEKIEETLKKTLEQFIEINNIKILINGIDANQSGLN